KDAATAPDLLDAVSATLQQLSVDMAMKNVSHRLLLASDQTVSWKVAGHPDQLGRELHNLLENALRHTPVDSTITVSLKDETQSVHVAIEDQGPGLQPALAGLLFERFRQGERCKGKAGLGLFFCRMTVERWGGQIGHESAENGGARFWFRLPKPKC